MGTSEFMVRWKDHSNTLSSVCKTLLDDNFLVDCTIAAEGKCLKAHRLILSACSPYFQLLFKQDNEKHPIVFFNDTKFAELKTLIDFIYQGEAQIPEDCLGAFFQLAHSLQIKGLNDVIKIHKFSLTTQTSSNNSIAVSSDPVPEISSAHSPVSVSRCYNKNDWCNGQEHGVAYSSDSCENASLNQHPYSLDVSTNLAKPNTSIPVQDCHSYHHEQINSLSISQQLSPSVEKSPSGMEQTIKCEPDGSEDLKPNFELIDLDESDGTADDLVENETQEINEEIFSGYQEENIDHLFPDHHRTEDIDSTNGSEKQNQQLSSPADTGLLRIHSEVALPQLSALDLLAHSEMRMRSKKERLFKCEICKMRFKQKIHLVYHMYCHTGERPFKCDICLSSFSRVDSLKRHMRCHTGERPYKCDICLATFCDPSNLRSHKIRHTGEKPYQCQMCDASFYFASELKSHIRSHTNERPYKCGECVRSFKHSHERIKHQRKCHSFPASSDSQLPSYTQSDTQPFS